MTTWELWEKTKGIEWDIFNEVLYVVFEEEKKDNEELSEEEIKKLYEATDFNERSGYDTLEYICNRYIYNSDLLEWFAKDLWRMYYVNDYVEEFGACESESGSFDIWKLLARAQAQYYMEQVDALNRTLRDILELED